MRVIRRCAFALTLAHTAAVAAAYLLGCPPHTALVVATNAAVSWAVVGIIYLLGDDQ